MCLLQFQVLRSANSSKEALPSDTTVTFVGLPWKYFFILLCLTLVVSKTSLAVKCAIEPNPGLLYPSFLSALQSSALAILSTGLPATSERPQKQLKPRLQAPANAAAPLGMGVGWGRQGDREGRGHRAPGQPVTPAPHHGGQGSE